MLNHSFGDLEKHGGLNEKVLGELYIDAFDEAGLTKVEQLLLYYRAGLDLDGEDDNVTLPRTEEAVALMVNEHYQTGITTASVVAVFDTADAKVEAFIWKVVNKVMEDYFLAKRSTD